MTDKTQLEAVAWALAQDGKTLAWGGFTQCVAFVRNYVAFLNLKQPPPVQGAKDLWTVDWGPDFTRHKDPQPGDIGVLKETPKNKSGHTDVAVEIVPGTLVTMDQNLTDPIIGGTQGSPVDKIAWRFPNDRFLGFIRPKFKEEEMQPKVNKGDVQNVFRSYGYEPNANDITAGVGKQWKDWYYNDVLTHPKVKEVVKRVACTPDERTFLDLRKKL
jgi:hypothetical protein